MKYLLTSGGVRNKSIHNALVEMLGKPIAECSALCIPTASYANRNGPVMAAQFVRGRAWHADVSNWGGSRWACWS